MVRTQFLRLQGSQDGTSALMRKSNTEDHRCLVTHVALPIELRYPLERADICPWYGCVLRARSAAQSTDDR